jgi:hypothetical protein
MIESRIESKEVNMNKMEFPKIKKSEYAVLMADSNTGVVLDIYFDIYYKSSNQIVYKVFSSLEEVKEFIKETLKQRENIEFMVYDNNENIVELQEQN